MQPNMTEVLHQLVQRAAEGDPEAVEQLLQQYLPGLNGFIRNKTGPLIRERETVADVVQVVCCEVLKKLDRFQFGGEAAFKHWLYATALRQVRNRAKYWRREKRSAARELRIEDRQQEGTQSFSSLLDQYLTLTTPSRRLMSGEELRRIEEAFQKLSDDHREIIALSRFSGLSHKEISERMGRTEKATRALLHRALETLSELLKQPPSQ